MCIRDSKRTCPLGDHRCMRDITVDEVYNASIGLLHEITADVSEQRAASGEN